MRLGSISTVIALALCACAPPADTTGLPNFVFVTLDTTRADHLGFHGYFRNTSPRLDALAEESIVFERALAPMATTLPTHVSLFTSTYPLEHGVMANVLHGGRRFVPAPELRSFAELSRKAGYRTGGFVSASPLKRDSGIASGFDVFVEPADNAYQRRAETTTEAVLEWLGALRSGPFLLWVHFYDAHWPFAPPEPYASMFRTERALEDYIAERRIADFAVRGAVGREESRQTHNAYDGELRYQDEQLGRVLDALRARDDWDRTVVVVVGDHGEGLAQHGHAAHGGTWNEQLHTPLLMRVPGQEPRRVAQPISLVDTLPTLLGLLDLPAFDALVAQSSGRDVLAGGSPTVPVLSQDTGRHRTETDSEDYRLALTDARWKYFRIEHPDGSREELYDLVEDPFELRDVAGRHPEQTARLGEQLRTLLAEQRQRGERVGAGDSLETDPAVVEQLRALGYVGGAAASPGNPDAGNP